MARLKQSITRWQGMGLMATTLLGAGVFILPQLTLQQAGALAPLSWILLTLAILPLALVFAALGREHPHAAGPAFFLQQAFGLRYGHVVGLMFLCVVPLGAPAALIMTFQFIKPLVTLSPSALVLAQLGAVAGLWVLNRRGLQMSAQLQLLLTLAIVGVVVVLILAWLIQPPLTRPALPASQASGVFAALALAIWGFLGIETITHLSAEFRDVRRDFIPAVLGGTLLVGIIYSLCSGLAMLAPYAPLAIAGAYEQLLGPSGPWVIAVLGIASGLATVNVYVASAARLAWALAGDGVLPSGLHTLNQHQIPSRALGLMLGLIALTLLAAQGLDQDFASMMRWVNGVFVLIYSAALLAAWRLLGRAYRPVIAVGGLVCVIFAYSLGTDLLYGVLLALLMLGWTHWHRPNLTQPD